MSPVNAAKYLYVAVIISVSYILLLSNYKSEFSGNIITDYFSLDLDSKDPILITSNLISLLTLPISLWAWKSCEGIAASHFKNIFFCEMMLVTTYVIMYNQLKLNNPSAAAGVIFLVVLIYYFYRYIKGFIKINKKLPY